MRAAAQTLRGVSALRAARLHGPRDVRLDEVPVPEPGADEVLVRIEATPINPSDLGLLFGPADMSTLQVAGSVELLFQAFPDRSLYLVNYRGYGDGAKLGDRQCGAARSRARVNCPVPCHGWLGCRAAFIKTGEMNDHLGFAGAAVKFMPT